MIAYHGTNKASANNIVGPPSNVDVTRGGGELGRGFYLGKSVGLAASWSIGRFGQEDGVVIEFDIDDSAYVQLKTKALDKKKVHRLWKRLKNQKKQSQHLFNVDVVYAPFATTNSCQYKFESQNAQTTLNNNSTKKIL